ncbi:hypothetical protein [Streptomyces sp. BBFR109]|uniref:hypothetical protein n=1 Tax=Streptomyces sp. BBFR109 TaxID=3448172 RepID=UPI003F758FC4
MTVAYAWAPITKTEEQDDGTLMVYGPAASSDLDRDQQRLNADWLDRAMPEWAQVGNVREQHDPKRAVGVGVGLTKAEDGSHHIAAHIVDDQAIKKIRTKVLKGFSVGIKNPRVVLGKADAPGGEVVDGSICEISVVDRPCNPGTLFEIAKADGAGTLAAVESTVVEKTDAEAFGIPAAVYEQLPESVRAALTSLASAGAAVSTESVKAESADGEVVVSSPRLLLKLDGLPVSEDMIRGLVDARVAELGQMAKADTSAAGRRAAAASGAAMPDGSYPIKTKADLRKAIKAVGRGGADHDKIRKHIIKRAKALGLEAMVPTNWNADGSLKTAAKADADDDLVAKAEQVLRDVRALAPSLTKADDEGEADGAADGGEHDEAQDIAGADEAIACIARLIISEAESLAQGNLNEACDIDLLLSAVRSLRWFKESEEYEQQMMAANKSDSATAAAAERPAESAAGQHLTAEQVAAVHAAGLAPGTVVTPEVVAEAMAAQAAAAGESADEGKTTEGEQPDDTAVTKADVAELVKAAVAEATTASEERAKALEVELAKANAAIEEFRAMPTPGGPALTRTAAQQAQAKNSDADRMRHDAAALMAKADQVADRDLRDGYRERAKALLAKADA